MPVYACWRGDCADIAFLEHASPFIARDAIGREWLCVELKKSMQEIPMLGHRLPELIHAQGLAHKQGFSSEGTETRCLTCDDEDDLRQQLILGTYPPPNGVKEQLALTGWGSYWQTLFAEPVRVIVSSGSQTVGAEGRNEAEAWHRVAFRVARIIEQERDAVAMVLKIVTEPVPIYSDADGALRIGESRVTLETVIHAFQEGLEVDEIVREYPTLDLADVHSVVAYYLRHKREVDDYLHQCEGEAEQLEKEIHAAQPSEEGLRAKLLARREQMREENAPAH